MRRADTRLSLIALLWALSCVQGCDESHCNTLPDAPELRDAAQILPDAHRSALGREELVKACQDWVACAGATAVHGATLATSADRVFDCVQAIVIAAEDGEVVLHTNESARFMVDCITDAAGACEQVLACSTHNPLYDRCAPVGCSRASAAVSCDGTVASIETEAGTVQRDCARSQRECSTESVSGCDDALAYACASGREDRVDSCSLSGRWCEGDLIVACIAGHARVFDCAAFGGTCVDTSDGQAQCAYGYEPDGGCASYFSFDKGADELGTYQCVRGRKVYLN